MTRPISDTERRAIEAIRAYSAEKVLSSAEGYALTVGRLCELVLAHDSASSERAVALKCALLCEDRRSWNYGSDEYRRGAEDCERNIRAYATTLPQNDTGEQK